MSAPNPKISDLFNAMPADKPVTVSFEYFPPKTEQGVTNLKARFHRMAKANPVFCDLTWGAGGSTSDLTLELSTYMKEEAKFVTNMHLTCTNMESEKIDAALAGAKKAGITNIVALRGDPPKDQAEWKAVDSGFSCALDLVKYIRSKYNDEFCLSVAGYPEGHPDVIDKETGKASPEAYQKDMDYLKAKVDAGAGVIITQMFFDVDIFHKFTQDCRAMGINVPIVPGFMLLQNYGGFCRMTDFCKTWVPQEIKDALEPIKDDEKAVKAYGIKLATEMCQKLVALGHTHLHFYCLNLDAPTYQVMEALGLPTGQDKAEE